MLKARDEKAEGGEDQTAERKGKKVRPNVFTALQVTSPQIHMNIKRVQESAAKSDPTLKEFLVSTTKAHITLHAFHADKDDWPSVGKAMERAVGRWAGQQETAGTGLQLHFQGIRTFRDAGKVVYAAVEENPQLRDFYEIVTEEISHLKLEGVRLHSSFDPHLTIMKLSRAKTTEGRKRRRIEELHYEEHKELDFGRQTCRSLQLLSMTAPPDPSTGYYSKLEEVPLPKNGGDNAPEAGTHSDCCLPKLPKYQKQEEDGGDQTALVRRNKDLVRKGIRERMGAIFAQRRLFNPKTLLACTLLAIAARFAINRMRNHQ